VKRARLIAFIALVVLQVLIIGNMASSRQAILDSGERVTLATRPVDPRDMFRGDYVVLRYQISTIDLGEVAWIGDQVESDQMVWVALNTSERIARPTAVSSDGPIPGVVSIRGTIMWSSPDSVAIKYGIEEYFVPEGTGREVEMAREVEVVVAVTEDGDSIIDYLILDGLRW
jgi:uncharacterized membrane-anchored protein